MPLAGRVGFGGNSHSNYVSNAAISDLVLQVREKKWWTVKHRRT